MLEVPEAGLRPKLSVLIMFYGKDLMVHYVFAFLGYINNILLQSLIESISFQ